MSYPYTQIRQVLGQANHFLLAVLLGSDIYPKILSWVDGTPGLPE